MNSSAFIRVHSRPAVLSKSSDDKRGCPNFFEIRSFKFTPVMPKNVRQKNPDLPPHAPQSPVPQPFHNGQATHPFSGPISRPPSLSGSAYPSRAGRHGHRRPQCNSAVRQSELPRYSAVRQSEIPRYSAVPIQSHQQ